jgi:hypothetical protein
MQKRPLDDSERFQDPLGAHMRAVSTAHAKRMARFAHVEEVYQAFYASFKPWDEEGARYLAGAEGIIGSALELERFDEGVSFVTRDGRRLAVLDGEVAIKLTTLLKQGWVVRCVLAYTIYRAEEKSFTGTFACISYSPQLDEEIQASLDTFISNITHRIANATHPGLDLTQEQFIRVIESKGAWFLTKEEPWPELPKGAVFYRRRRTFNDRLISTALEGNRGCVVASWVGMVVIIAAILWAIWFFFLSG